MQVVETMEGGESETHPLSGRNLRVPRYFHPRCAQNGRGRGCTDRGWLATGWLLGWEGVVTHRAAPDRTLVPTVAEVVHAWQTEWSGRPAGEPLPSDPPLEIQTPGGRRHSIVPSVSTLQDLLSEVLVRFWGHEPHTGYHHRPWPPTDPKHVVLVGPVLPLWTGVPCPHPGVLSSGGRDPRGLV